MKINAIAFQEIITTQRSSDETLSWCLEQFQVEPFEASD
jgi:hypothetical protein